MPDLIAVLKENGVVPLIAAGSPDRAVGAARALAAGGLSIVEVVQRTDAGLDCLEAVALALPEVLVGAGTVLSPSQAEDCLARGARFLVSPGLDEEIVDLARRRSVDVLPGIVTPTELQRAWRLGLRLLKFFPAASAGGPPAIDALAGLFRDVRFVPTGGVTAANLADYLAVPAVLACAGSWIAPPSAVAAGDQERIAANASAALAIARRARAEHRG